MCVYLLRHSYCGTQNDILDTHQQLTRFEKSISKLTGTQKPKFWKTAKKHWTLLNKTALEKLDIWWCSDITWYLRICEILVSSCAVFAITLHAAFILWSQSDISKQSKRMEIRFSLHVTIPQHQPAPKHKQICDNELPIATQQKN